MGVAPGIAIGTSAIGSILGASNDIQQGQAQAGQDRSNAALAGYQAFDALNRGSRTVGQIRTRGSQIIGQQKVGYAASGIDTQSGTALDTMADSRMMSELDAATVRNNAARQAWGYRVQQSNYLSDANSAEDRGVMGAAGGILGGIGSIAGLGGRR